jgi:predicted DNA binding CopG/RHH family protein
MTRSRRLEHVGVVELDEAESERIAAMIEQAEHDIAMDLSDVRVAFRWNREPLSVVKRAAALIGVPYQTYLKQTVFEKAVRDLEAFQRAVKPG